MTATSPGARDASISTDTMNAWVQRTYGGPETVRPERIEVPAPGRGEVLLRLRATGVNNGDTRVMRGEPLLLRLAFGLRRPKQPVRGMDVLVAERLVRAGSPSLRAGPTLAASVRTLAAQWPLVRNAPDRVRAFAEAIRRARIAARSPLIGHLRASLSSGRLWEAARSLGRLLGYLLPWLRSFALQLRTGTRPDP